MKLLTRLFAALFSAAETTTHDKDSKSMNNTTMPPGQPIVLELEPGTYYRCTCGGSKNLRFCDGSCQGSDCAPVEFTLEEKQQVYLCNCGKTGSSPFCDGSCAK